ncbi:MAG TPA: hypothetical protein VIL01_09660 [Thermomicrobiales bacterium]
MPRTSEMSSGHSGQPERPLLARARPGRRAVSAAIGLLSLLVMVDATIHARDLSRVWTVNGVSRLTAEGQHAIAAWADWAGVSGAGIGFLLAVGVIAISINALPGRRLWRSALVRPRPKAPRQS